MCSCISHPIWALFKCSIGWYDIYRSIIYTSATGIYFKKCCESSNVLHRVRITCNVFIRRWWGEGMSVLFFWLPFSSIRSELLSPVARPIDEEPTNETLHHFWLPAASNLTPFSFPLWLFFIDQMPEYIIFLFFFLYYTLSLFVFLIYWHSSTFLYIRWLYFQWALLSLSSLLNNNKK